MTDRQITEMLRGISPHYQQKANARAAEAARKAEASAGNSRSEHKVSAVWRYVLTAGCVSLCLLSAFMIVRMFPKDIALFSEQSSSDAEQTGQRAASETDSQEPLRIRCLRCRRPIRSLFPAGTVRFTPLNP